MEIFDMGGYGVFVWSSVALGVAVYAWNLLIPSIQRQSVIDQIAEADVSDEDES